MTDALRTALQRTDHGDLLLAPPHLDPETAKHKGSILNIVRSAHKWGGDGTVPDFDKIKRVLTTKHPEVIAKAFGGDPNRAAAWIKDQWYSIFRPGVQWRGKKDKTPGFSLGYDVVPIEAMQGGDEIFLSDSTSEQSSDGLTWLPISKTGRWVKSPLPGNKPLVLTRQFFEEVKDSFDKGAWEHVTVPLSHADRPEENSGFVRALDIRPDPTREGEHKLWGGIDFRVPEVRERVLQGAIAGRSIGVATKGITRTEDGQFFPTVLKHVALTNQPWIAGLDDGETLAASWESLDDLEMLGLADPSNPDAGSIASQPPAEANWHEAKAGGDSCSSCVHFDGKDFCDRWNAHTGPEDVSNGFENASDTTQRDVKASVIRIRNPRDMELAAARLAAAKGAGDEPVVRVIRLSRGGENMGENDGVLELTQEELDAQVAEQVRLGIEADREARDKEMDALRLSNRELTVERKVAAAQAKGHAPAVIKAAREVWLADVRETPILTLSRQSDDGETEVAVSASQVVDDLLAAIPEGGLSLAKDDHTAGIKGSKPETDDPQARADALWEELHPTS